MAHSIEKKMKSSFLLSSLNFSFSSGSEKFEQIIIIFNQIKTHASQMYVFLFYACLGKKKHRVPQALIMRGWYIVRFSRLYRNINMYEIIWMILGTIAISSLYAIVRYFVGINFSDGFLLCIEITHKEQKSIEHHII